jgi:hypothetical protein
MEKIEPDLVLPGHGPSYRPPDDWMERMREYTGIYEKIHTSLMPLADDEVHFNVDSRAAWLAPYRSAHEAPAKLTWTATVRNPYPEERTFALRLVVPAGWRSSPVEMTIAGRAEAEAEVGAVPPPATTCRRQPVALEVRSDERTFGQVAEALVTIGSGMF